MALLCFPFLFLLLHSAATSTANATGSAPLDPRQLKALHSLGLPILNLNPCSLPTNATLCDSSFPFRHLLSLRLSNCSSHLSFSLKSPLSTLQHLTLLNCPATLTGVFLSRLTNLAHLTISAANIRASGPSIFLHKLESLQFLTLTNTTLSGYLPKSWHHNFSHIDLSNNHLKGMIHSSITSLHNLLSLNLSSNHLHGEIPTALGHLMNLKNLSLASNSLSGPIPESMAAIPSLVHLDLSRNQFNGTIPGFLADMKELKYLNLENNNFHGVMPFNVSFIRKLKLFKVGQNSNLCYNHSFIPSKMELGIAPCDSYGFPLSPPAEAVDSGGSDDMDYGDGSDDETSQKDSGRRGPNEVVLAVAIALSSIIFLIIFLMLLSKWCA